MMMGRLNHDQRQLFYSFRLDEVVADDHLVREIAAILDLSWVRSELAPYYCKMGRPSTDPELMIRMLIVGYVFAIRSERMLCREVKVDLAVPLRRHRAARSPPAPRCRSRSRAIACVSIPTSCPSTSDRKLSSPAGGSKTPRPATRKEDRRSRKRLISDQTQNRRLGKIESPQSRKLPCP
jgi:hypothetical protein